MAIVTTKIEWSSTTMEGYSVIFNMDPDEWKVKIELRRVSANEAEIHDFIVIDLASVMQRNDRIRKAAEQILLHFGCSYAEQNSIARKIRQMVL